MRMRLSALNAHAGGPTLHRYARSILFSVSGLLCSGVYALGGQGGPAGASAPTLLVAVDQRPVQSLDGFWHILVDPYRAGFSSSQIEADGKGYFEDEEVPPGSNKLVEYGFAKSPTIRVPGDWNMQMESLRMYEGGVWYERHVLYETQPGHRVYLHIGAANYRARAYVNGKLVCTHEGGFTPFDCEVTQTIKGGDNSVVIYVDSTRIPDGVPTLKTDWFNYGGLTRDVSLVTVPARFVDDFELHLDRATRQYLEGYVHVEGAQAGMKVQVLLPETRLQMTGVTGADGRVAVKFPAKGLVLWTPEIPRLYKVQIRAESDVLTDTMGFRTIGTFGSRIVLNGKPVVLHGVCLHAEAPMHSGRVSSQDDVGQLLAWAKEMGANYVRLAHYPHDEKMTRTADRMGLMVWSEVPVYWSENFGDEAVFEKSKQQIHEMIRRDRDKASVILWSVANETPNTETRTGFLTRSVALVREEDPSRLVTAALLVRGEGNTKIIDDPLGKVLDVIGFNEYIGWYEKTPEAADAVEWKIGYDKPLIVSEFGGGAKAGMHGKDDERWTEEFQANLYRHQITMLNKIPQLRGATAWVLMDFRSPLRQLPGIQDGFNRKGLISDQGKKKLAYFVLQKAYKENALGHAE